MTVVFDGAEKLIAKWRDAQKVPDEELRGQTAEFKKRLEEKHPAVRAQNNAAAGAGRGAVEVPGATG